MWNERNFVTGRRYIYTPREEEEEKDGGSILSVFFCDRGAPLIEEVVSTFPLWRENFLYFVMRRKWGAEKVFFKSVVFLGDPLFFVFRGCFPPKNP